MKHHMIQEGDSIHVRVVKLPRPNVSKGDAIKIQPHSKAFYKMKGNDMALAMRLSNFTTLSEGEPIPIIDTNTGKEHLVQVVETNPTHAVCIHVLPGQEMDLLYDVVSPPDETLKPIEKDEFDKMDEDIDDDLKEKDEPIIEEPKLVVPERKVVKKEEKQPLAEDEIECSNCKKNVKKSNQIHFIQCARNNTLCKKCNTVYKNSEDEKKKHESDFHGEIECPKCHKKVEKFKLEDHEFDECEERIVRCSVCSEGIYFKNKDTHEKECATKTVFCKKCKKDILKKDFSQHPSQCKPKEEKKEVIKSKESSPIEDHHFDQDFENSAQKETKSVLPSFLQNIFGKKKPPKNDNNTNFKQPIEKNIEIQQFGNNYSCPLCQFPGMSKEQFIDHLFTTHSDDHQAMGIVQSLMN